MKRPRGKTQEQASRIVHVASFGGGVNSVAGVLEEGFEKYAVILFADTGSEKKETYAYLDYLTKTLGWPIKFIQSKYGNIYDYYYKKKIYPTRFARDCTGKFKIDPFNKYLRETYGYDAHFIVDIFIDSGEPDRVRTSRYLYATLNYPLVEKNIDRKQCELIIKSHNMPVPVKSGCYFCMFTPPSVWRQMERSPQGSNAKEYYEKSINMERNSIMRAKAKYPLVRLRGKDMSELFECGCYTPNFDTEAGEKELEKILQEVDYSQVKRT